MIFRKKYCPSWVYDCVVAQIVNDYILYGVDLMQPCKNSHLVYPKFMKMYLLKSWLGQQKW